MSLGTPALSSTGGGGGSSTITSFLGSTTNAPMNITQIGGNAVTTTIPVSGTVTANAGTGTFNIQSNASVNISQVGGSSFSLGQQLAAASLPVVLTASQLSTLTPLTSVAVTQSTSPWVVAGGGTAGSAASGVITVQGIASMTKLLVTPDANSAVNISQMNGVAVTMGNGVSGTGVQRVTIASDSTGQVTLAAGANTIGALTANQSVNVAQLAGNTISSGVGASGTGTLRVVDANDVGRTLKSAGGSASSSGNNTLVAAGTNKLKVFAFSLSTTSTTAVTCIFQSGASGTELWRVVLQAATSTNTGANLAITPPSYLFSTASATLLNLNLSGAQTVHWSVSYFDEA